MNELKFAIINSKGEILDKFRTEHCAKRSIGRLKTNRYEELNVERLKTIL